MKNVLILGSTSFTGHYICEMLHDDYDFIKCNRSGINADAQFDVNCDSINTLEGHLKSADVVINCISNGDLDSCEVDPLNSSLINLKLVEDLCKKQKKHGFHLVHFSSNAVYDGDKPPYRESSPKAAINRYGQIKIEADEHIQSNLDNYTILRPITMFGIRLGDQRHNPFSFFYQQILNNKDIDAVDDVYTNMLHIEDLIACVGSVINKQAFGTYNISGDNIVNRYEFVSIIKKAMPNSLSKINRVTSEQFKTVAKRPRNTSFDNNKMKSELGVYPADIESTLQRLVDTMQRHQQEISRCAG